jgi:hypothetical protein
MDFSVARFDPALLDGVHFHDDRSCRDPTWARRKLLLLSPEIRKDLLRGMITIPKVTGNTCSRRTGHVGGKGNDASTRCAQPWSAAARALRAATRLPSCQVQLKIFAV